MELTLVPAALIELACMFAAYFAPALIARFRHRPNGGAIFAFNLLLGWTVIGWVVALVWALTWPMGVPAARR